MVFSSYSCVALVMFLNRYYTYCCDKETFHNIRIKLSTDAKLSKYTSVTGCLSPSPSFYLPEAVAIIECYDENVPIFYEKAVADINIKILRFSNNQIRFIKKGAFYNLSELWFLQIIDNKIDTIEKDSFMNLPKLIFLDLRKNKLAYLEDGIFENLPLQELALNNNQLEAFEPKWFNQGSSLITLHLDNNFIRTIQEDTFKGFSKLNCISVSYNHIHHIHKNAFEGMHYLTSLRLSYNRIKKLEEGIFKTPELRQLWLHGNNLTYISNETLNEISKFSKYGIYQILLTLHINPWQCACYNRLLEWCAKNSIDIEAKAECRSDNNPVCVFPDKTECLEDIDQDINNFFYKEYNFNHECTDKSFRCSWDHINDK